MGVHNALKKKKVANVFKKIVRFHIQIWNLSFSLQLAFLGLSPTKQQWLAFPFTAVPKTLG